MSRIEIVQTFADRRCGQHKHNGAVRVGCHIINAGDHDGHIFEHLEVIGKVAKGELAIQNLAAECHSVQVRPVLKVVVVFSGEESLGEGNEENGEDDPEDDRVDLRLSAEAN